MAKDTTYDWLKIEREYIQGIKTRDITTGELKIHYPTHKELIAKYGMHYKTIEDRSRRDKWSLRRTQYQNKLKVKNNEVDLQDLLGESAKFDALHLSILEKVVTLTNAKIEPYIQMLEDDSVSFTNEEGEPLPPLTSREIKDLVQIVKDSHSTVRSILGEGTNTENLLENIREQIVDDYNTNRKQKKLPASYLINKVKEIEKIQKDVTELELRKEELKRMLDEQGK